MTVDIEGGLKEMCNLSGLIEENAIKKVNVEKIKKMILKGCSKEFILELDYTEDEYAEVEAELCQLV